MPVELTVRGAMVDVVMVQFNGRVLQSNQEEVSGGVVGVGTEGGKVWCVRVREEYGSNVRTSVCRNVRSLV